MRLRWSTRDSSRCLAGGEDLEVLADLFVRHGPPEYLRSDNGPEFTARRSNVDGFMPVRSRDAPTRDSKCFVSVSMAVGVETRHVRTRLCTAARGRARPDAASGGWC